MAILSGFLLVVLILAAILLIIIVLMQDEQGEGLGGIFGGGGAAPVGSRAGNVLTRTTAIIATIFLVSLFAYAWINRTPGASDVEAQARQLEAESGAGVEWWNVQEPTDTSGTISPTTTDTPSGEPVPAAVDQSGSGDSASSATDTGGNATP